MKRYCLIVFSVLMLFTNMLKARDNPFKPTQAYDEKKKLLLKFLKQTENKVIHDKVVIKKVKNKEMILNHLEEKKLEDIANNSKKIKNYQYNLLSFIDIRIIKDTMKISTKYKLKNKFIIEKSNKIVFDYICRKKFNTHRNTLSTHKDFKKITIGSHPKEHYFRVVIQTNKNVFNYMVDIYQNGTVAITKK